MRPDPDAPSDTLIKSDGSDIVLSAEGLTRLMRRSMMKATHCLESIAAGQFSINPTRPESGDYNPCRYCLAKGACGIESTEEVELLPDVRQIARMLESASTAADQTDQTERHAESQSPLEFLLRRDDARAKDGHGEEAGG